MIELMVALAVAAVLIGLALPAFTGFIVQRNLTAEVNDFVIAVTLARSEAMRRRSVVTLQSVDASDASDEWGDGWCVTDGNPGDCTAPLRVFDGRTGYTFDANGAFDTRPGLSFNARGLLALGVAGTLDLCHQVEDPGRRITISPIGRVTTQDLVCNP